MIKYLHLQLHKKWWNQRSVLNLSGLFLFSVVLKFTGNNSHIIWLWTDTAERILYHIKDGEVKLCVCIQCVYGSFISSADFFLSKQTKLINSWINKRTCKHNTVYTVCGGPCHCSSSRKNTCFLTLHYYVINIVNNLSQSTECCFDFGFVLYCRNVDAVRSLTFYSGVWAR